MSKICLCCGTEFKRSKSAKFCSVKCKSKYHHDKNKFDNPDFYKEYRSKNTERINIAAKKHRNKLRDEAFSVYGKSCVVCGVSEREFLAFDHINNDGNAHRKKNPGGSYTVLSDLKKRGWPPEVQVMCHNCNTKKQKSRTTPTSVMAIYEHKRKIRVVEKYGGKCDCCGVTDIDILQIDHTDGGGNRMRMLIGDGSVSKGSSRTYSFLDKSTPLCEYRVLCANCNLSRGFYGGCPHERNI